MVRAKRNDKVDLQAKLAVIFHLEIHEGTMKEGEELGRPVENVLRFVARVSLLWPNRPRAKRRHIYATNRHGVHK